MKICNFMKTANRKTLDALGVSKTYSPKKENIFSIACLPRISVVYRYILSTGSRSRLARGALREGFAKQIYSHVAIIPGYNRKH